MFSLIETLTGFAAIMLMLSLLVKTLTSVLKNYFDYYSDNLEHEVKRLVFATTGKTWDQILANIQTPQLKEFASSIPWKRLGSEILNAGYLSWFLRQLDQNAKVSDLESRLKIHVANVNYTFQMRMKNLALAVGLGMCLLGNINAFTIWKTLYTDQQLRATFSTNYADKATKLAEDQAKGKTPGAATNQQNQPNPASQANPTTAPKGNAAGAATNPQNQASPAGPANASTGSTTTPSKADLDAQMKGFQQNMKGFLSDVSFGVGRIWNEKCLSLTDPPKNEKQCQDYLRYLQKKKGAEKIEDQNAREAEKKAADDEWAAKQKADAAAEASLERARKALQDAARQLTEAENITDPAAKTKAQNDAKSAQTAAQAQVDVQEASLGLTTNAKETQSGLGIFFYEFFGSLLTGILVSIGAPYWHDILQALSSLRSIKPAAPEKAKA